MNNVTVTIPQAFAMAAEHYQHGRLEPAEQICRQILAVQPDNAGAMHMLGLIVQRTGWEDPIPLLRRSYALQDNPHTLHSLGTALHHAGELVEAEKVYRAVIKLLPDLADAHFNLGMVRLVQGDLTEGFAELEWRTKVPGCSVWTGMPQPRWDGGELAGRTLLLHFEQGFGDSIQLVRYVALILERNPRAQIVVDCQRELNGLFTRNLPQCRVISAGSEMPPFDVQCPLMSLPHLLGTTLATVPAQVPYLKIDPEKGEAWRRLVGHGGARRVGLVWSGSAAHKDDRKRSVVLAALAPLGRVAGVTFYSLQKGEAASQAAAVPGLRLVDLTAELRDFDDTAACIANLDLVIAVDTAVAHLAGALGKPVWLLLPSVPDWRWMLARNDSPWYPTMRLFRQQRAGDWNGLMGEVAGELTRWAGSPLAG